MKLLRVGEKLIDRQRIDTWVDRILELRAGGLTQQEVGRRLGLERSFISRLEGLGEVRKGGRIAVVGFPVANKEELAAVLAEEGVDFWLLLTDRERWEFANRNGLAVLNELTGIVERLRQFDTVVMLGSAYRIRFSEALLDRPVVGVEIGQTPIREDKWVDPGELRRLIRQLITGEEEVMA